MQAGYTIQTIDEVFEVLVSPTYHLRREWDTYLRTRYKRKQDERLYFFDMMEISAMIMKRFKNQRAKTLRLFFEHVEVLLDRGDADVRNLLQAGLIEGIQQICPYRNIDMRDAFDPWLLPQTKKVWDELAYGFYTFE